MIKIPRNFGARLVRFILGRPAPTTQDVFIASIPIGRSRPCFFVAEIGINHNGSIEIAKRLIDAASEAGAQAVKFQKRTVPVVYLPEELAKPRAVDRTVLENAINRGVLSPEAVVRLQKSDFKDSTNGDLKWALEFTEAEYRGLFDYAKSKGLLAFASPWDLESVDVLERLNVPCCKIASANLTDHDLLRKARATGKPVILSTGMSTSGEVSKAVEVLGTQNLILLHTVSTYPSEDSELNIRVITKMRQEFPTVPIGYSGHEKGLIPTLAAANVGAHMIERHITLDKKMFGTDQSASLEPQEFAQLIRDVRIMEKAHGDGIKRVLPSEIPIREKLRKV
ncbi:MAG: N-acetylneuraminate synthase family protein [Patescibacteria group bacterium]